MDDANKTGSPLNRAQAQQRVDRIRAFQEELLARNADARFLCSSATGGSTGIPLQFKYDRTSYEWRQAAHMRGNTSAGSWLGTTAPYQGEKDRAGCPIPLR